MASTKISLLGLATLALQASGYTLTAYKGKGCTGDVQQTITDTKYGDICQYFKSSAESIKVEGSTSDTQWIFFNNWCGKDSQVGSFSGDGCMTMGKTKLKGVGNIIPEGSKKRDLEASANSKRAPAGTVKTWKNTDCSGNPTNSMTLINENLPVTLNNVDSIMASGVPDNDIAFACSDSDCHVDNQVATLTNGQCVNVKGKKVKSAMAIGVPTPPRRREARQVQRDLIAESGMNQMVRRVSNIKCNADNGPDYKDALKVGDAWQGSNGLGCCCWLPTFSGEKTSGSAKASISEAIRCPVNPKGSSPPPSQCPLNCNEMRSYVYAIATQCKNSAGKTGGSADLGNGETITVSHS